MTDEQLRSAGYKQLTRQHHIATIPNWHESDVSLGSALRIEKSDDSVHEIFPAKYWPGNGLGDHLEFALKYDGTNLLILAKLFDAIPQEEIAVYVQSKSNGKYARRIWYLYELLTNHRLPLDDLHQGNYVDLLDADDYYTAPATARPRQRIRDNLLGDARFCPTVRRTEVLKQFAQSGIAERCRQIMASYPAELLARALGYLYTKETKSSFAIEHLTPNVNRTERFVALLRLAEKEDFFSKPALLELQNRIVDERFQDHDYRSSQNYVGQTVAYGNERVHFVPPKPGDLPALMDGMMASHRRMGGENVHPVIHAAVIAYGLVFMHPFEDGNGRIHRFLIHNVLARRGFTPQGIMFPVSAAMLKRMDAYNASLEAFSRPLLSLIDYALDEQGRMTVGADTAGYYRYIDFTPQAEALFAFIRETIEVELVEELRFLVSYDTTKRAIQEVVDMPDRQIDLFIRCCLQNHGKLAQRKRADWFAMLGDDEVLRMEQAIQRAYQPV